MADPRLEWFAQVLLVTYNTREFTGSEALQSFLDDSAVVYLSALKDEHGKVKFTTDVNETGFVSETTFLKRTPCSLTAESLASEVQLSSPGGSTPMELLNALLTSYFNPRLLGAAGAVPIPAKLQTLLQDLKDQSGQLIRQSSSDESSGGVDAFGGIVTPMDEVDFWSRYSGRSIDSDLVRGMNDAFDTDRGKWREELEALGPPSGSSHADDAVDWERMEEFLDLTADVLDACWNCNEGQRHVYPQPRMVHFLDVFSSFVVLFVQRSLRQSLDVTGAGSSGGDGGGGASAATGGEAVSGSGVWRAPFSLLRANLRSAIGVCERWVGVVAVATGTLWAGGRWAGKAHEDGGGAKLLAARLEAILDCRASVEELRRLLPTSERRDYGLSTNAEAFKPFEATQLGDPFLCNSYTQLKFDACVAAWRRRISGAEAVIAASFRRSVSSLLSKPSLLLREFTRFSHILQRPAIAQELSSERENLLGLLIEQLDAVEHSFDDHLASIANGDKTASGFGCGLSKAVSGMVLCRQTHARTAAQRSTCRPFFRNLRAYGEYEAMGEALLRKCKQQEQELLGEWSEERLGELENQDLSLRMRGQLMEIPFKGPNAGQLVVNFDERLVVLLREVRQLNEMALAVPKEVAEAAQEAEKYYRYGVMLKKVATFWNSLGDGIIPSQRPMLLNALKAFEKIVRSRTSDSGVEITWKTPSECEQYVERLEAAASKLSTENASLRRSHSALAAHVAGIMGIDLLRQKETWKQRWGECVSLMEGLKRRYPEEHMKKWVRHWDQQMYKALECAYQMGLESLNENLAEIRTEVVFSQKALQFKPGIEELRSVYYREMKKFVSIPSNFPGFGGNKDVYSGMGNANTASLVNVYRKAELLFAKLAELLESYRPWCVLGFTVEQWHHNDMGAFVADKRVTEVPQFEANFKMLKQKRKDTEKLPDVVKLDCVRVSLSPLKASLEDQMQRLTDALLVALRRGVLESFKDVDLFLNESMDTLSSRPASIDEITAAQTAWEVIGAKRDEVKGKSAACLDKKKALLQHAPGNSDVDVSEVTSRVSNLDDGEGGRWDTFDIAMEAFHDMILEQKEALRSVLADEVTAFNASIDRFSDKWRALKPGGGDGAGKLALGQEKAVLKVFEELEGWQAQFADLQDSGKLLVESCESFGMDPPLFDGLAVLEADMETTVASFTLLKDYTAALSVVAEKSWIDFRGNVFELQDVCAAWGDKCKERIVAGNYVAAVTEHVMDQVEGVKHAMPALKFCRGEPFGEDHWAELLQGKLKLSRDVKLVNLKVSHFLSALEVLSEASTLTHVKQLHARAQGEVTIREALSELKAWSQTAEIKQLEHEEAGRRTPIITGWKDLFLELGDKQSLLSSLKESAFFKAFADQGAVFDSKMASLDTYLHSLNTIQRKWVYLEPIFERGALPSEQPRFRRVDVEFRDIMNKLETEAKLFSLADEHLFHGLKESLEKQVDQLERCQKALTEFLEEKRNAMPRFYFLGDDDLLEILGQAKNPVVIQSHLKKLFQGIHSVQFNEGSTEITAMVSSIGEVVQLSESVGVSDRVEEWLANLTVEMARTLKDLVTQCLKQGTQLEAFPSQVLQVAENIKFVDLTESTMHEGGLGSIKKDLSALLKQYTSLPNPSALTSNKVKALILDLVHNMDVLDQLTKHDTRHPSEWQWFKQLRLYDEKGGVKVKMVDGSFDYTYEYQGNAPKLVHTPLTDKCYLTLTQGMHMGFGGNPYGPAGTGKTESVKALGQAFGRQVLVFNCDEGIDFQSMGRIFIGLVKCGAWGCFDEFNRLKEDQLSAISQQIQVIQDAIKTKTPSVTLMNIPVEVDFNAGIFVTLNPAGKGYGGRSRLPDNLKALFRPVCLALPDNEQIAEVVLYSEGYTTAKALSTKVVSLFTLSKQLLSHQQHYEWGLRALKAILNTAGKFLQQAQAAQRNAAAEGVAGGEGKADGDVSTFEAETLIKAVRVNTLSKLTFGDTDRFLDLIKDLFPGVASSDVTIPELEGAIREVMPSLGLQVDETQIKKMLQMKESIDQRIGCVVVGPSGSGKTTVWQVLQQAMLKCGQVVKTHVMNPKAMPRPQLLGSMDHDTREWTDGVLTDASRKVVVEPSDVRSWIVCDGDVDPEWIESLNSVLDDNHLLTLPNGERIAFGDNVNFLFETHDLRFASPATVSRMGMIFLSEDDIDVKRVCEKWLGTLADKDSVPALRELLDAYFYRALEAAMGFEFVVETTLVGTVSNGLSQLSADSSGGLVSKATFLCGLVRGLGGNLNPSDREKLAKLVFGWGEVRVPDSNAPLDCYADDNGTLLPFTPSADPSMLLSEVTAEEATTLASVIPTVSAQRTLAMMKPWVDNCHPFILVGPEGCGKDMLIRHAFRQRRSTSVTVLNCNAQTTAQDVISKISQACSLFSAPEGRVYRPRDSERLVLYLKDLNLPKPDMYDTCMLIAFLQQLVTFGGFYDTALEFLRIERVQIVCSMNPATTVGRHPLSTRFTAIVRIGVLDYPQPSELESVCEAQLGVAFEQLKAAQRVDSQRWAGSGERAKLAATMVEVYAQLRSKFSVDDQRHYLFQPRDLSAWTRSLLRYDTSPAAGVELLDAVAHEAMRLFRDKLVDSEHEQRFDSILSSVLRSKWGHTTASPSAAQSYFTTLGQGKQAPGSDAPPRVLERLQGDDLLRVCEQGLTFFEREEKDLGLLLFPQVLDHLVRIDRVLSQPRGHLLLAGRSGVGRRCAATLVSYMLGYNFVTPSVTKDFGVEALKNELKQAIQTAGIDGEATTLYLEDHQLSTDAILEVINSLLSSGEVPGLYTHEELEPLLGPLKEKAMEDASGRFKNAYEFFVHQVCENLHVVVSMDPTSPKFLMRCEANPALYTRCSMLWMGTWSDGAMSQLPSMLPGVRELLRGEFGDEDEDNKNGVSGGGPGRGGSGEGKGGERKKAEKKGGEKKGGERKGEKSTAASAAGGGDAGAGGGERSRGGVEEEAELLALVLYMHGSVPGATPLEYLSFLNSWKTLHDSKRGGMSNEIKKLRSGLFKLNSATETVDVLSKDAAVSAKELAEAQIKADNAMETITKVLAGASERRQEVKELSLEVAEKDVKTRDRQEHIKKELSSIQPILDSAKAAVGGIKPEHLNEITALKMPPDAIADVLGAVLKLLGVRDVSWLSMKKFLRSRGVKEDILNFDASKLSEPIRNEVAKLLQAKASSFDHATITRVSVAAAPLAAWVKANVKYSLVLEKIQPLTAELTKSEKELELCTSRLSSCNAEIDEIDEKVGKLKKEFADRTREAESLRFGLEKVQATLSKAEGLLGQLSGEQQRWTHDADTLAEQLSTLPKLMLLAAGFTAYLACKAEDARAQYLTEWCQEAKLGNRGGGGGGGGGGFDYARLLTTESQLLKWKSDGLPSDSLSQENALVIANSGARVPFVIDPANAATSWLRTFLAADPVRPLEAVAAFDPRFVSQVELAVRFGKTLLLLDMDGMDPMLYPLARRDLTKQGSRSCVVVGEKVMDWNENFRMCVVTRNPEVELPPDAAALVVEVNFSVTRSGLEGQLLGITIKHEQPELEAQKQEMLQQEEGFKLQLAELEASLLAALAEAEGDLLENTALIESLTSTKKLAAQIGESLELSAKASVKLDEQRDGYRPFATSGSALFFLVTQLTSINNMYRFSLASFTTMFEQVLDDPKLSSSQLQERLRLLSPALENSVLYYVGRGLFKADRVMWALHLVKGMRPDAFGLNEWEFLTDQLIVGGDTSGARGGGGGKVPSVPEWVPADRSQGFAELCNHFPKLVHALELENEGKWKRFGSSGECEQQFPVKATGCQRLVVIKALRPDRLLTAMQQFAAEMLRVASLAPPPLPFAQILSDLATSPAMPILLITTPGSDPSKELQDFAFESVGRGKYRDLAMGGGQQQAALDLVNAAAQAGDWVCLKNLHLVVAWLPTLEKAIASLAASMHPSFRLWLTTEPHPLFPPILLQSSLKITFESPPGIKKNLQRTLATWGKDYLDHGVSSGSPVKGGDDQAAAPASNRRRAQLLFLLSWFHAVVQERRTYLPQGWSKAYEFSIGDLRAGAMVLDAVAKESKGELDFKLIHGLMEDAIYGGRVDNPSDLRVLRTYVTELYNPGMLGRGGDLTKGIRMPSSCTYEDLTRWAHDTLPDDDSPSLFGLPENIQRAVQKALSTVVNGQLRSLSVAGASTHKFNREKWRASLGPLIDLWTKLLDGENLKAEGSALAGSKKVAAMPPTEQFVIFENDAATQLCGFVEAQVQALKKVIFGSALLTPGIQAVGTALMRGDVPGSWEKKWDSGPEVASAWLTTLVRKKKALTRWAASASGGKLLSSPLHLADLFNPGTFLNALRQQSARRLKVPLEETRLVSAWDAAKLTGCDLVATVDGLLVENADVDAKTGCLVEVSPAAPETSRAPLLSMAFVPLNHPTDPYRGDTTLEVPVYHSSTREKLLVDISVPLVGGSGRGDSADSSKWILAGVAFLLSGE